MDSRCVRLTGGYGTRGTRAEYLYPDDVQWAATVFIVSNPEKIVAQVKEEKADD